MKLLDPAALDCLAALVDEGSFERAAHRLAITQSAVSQRLRALEMQIGQPLVVRSRPLRLTGPGQVLLRYARQLQALRSDVARDLGEHIDIEDRVPIAVNADSLATWVLPALQPLVDDGISLELIVDDQDFTHDWLREGRVLGCVSTLAEALRGCRVTPLCSMRYVAVASPRFVERMIGASGLSRRHLAQVPFVVFNRKDDVQAQWVERALELPAPRLLQRYVPSSEAYVQAVERGWGIGVAAWPLVRSRVEAGTLRLLRPDVQVPVELHWHQWKLADAVSAGTARPGLLDRIGAALAAGVPQDGPIGTA
ncbi:LysR family transcriptional regulator ArgP [Sphaerotilus uruguayifluvii]|uniref:LysR family transcriptional regulator (Chromosome initiation inhibitor) n=1 Tax=Sphaerotilus uruguayifluvii TaxID=2735897 RepID=A0ABX2G8V5_9BURK|nr:LysR family transcriptional regulator ArgP [Leptothrix sp. C29]NRT58514.1 LysR family transcriptional regulator (chromosome initiation inhibitor) [Leptothrix sp. C29]